MNIRNAASRHSEAWLVLGEDVSSFLMVENHLKHWKMITVTDGNQAMQRKAVHVYSIMSLAQKPFEGHALGTVNTMQNSVMAQRKSIDLLSHNLNY